MSKPFYGYRIVDVSSAISGPLCSYLLGLLGAEIIRVDNPTNRDITRSLDSDKKRSKLGMGWNYLMLNANKRSVSINLKQKDGKEVFKKLVATADVLIENFRPGVMDKLGFGLEKIRDINPKIISCSISGYGKGSHFGHYPAWDNVIQGISGLMSLSGTEESGPMRVGTPIVDCVTALSAAFATASALLQRRETEQSQHIDVAMFDSIITMMSSAVGEYIYEKNIPFLRGNKAISKTPFTGCFPTKDGFLVVGAVNRGQTDKLTGMLGCSYFLEDPQAWGTWQHQELNDKITEFLNCSFQKKTAEEWERELNENGVPAGKVRDVREVFEHPNTKARELYFDVHALNLNQDIKVPNCGFKYEHDGPSVVSEPPFEGADSSTILQELGYTQKEIALLFKSGGIEKNSL